MVKAPSMKMFKKNASMLSLFNAYFFKTVYGPILSLIFPSVLLIVMGHILRLEYVFPGIVAFCSMLITVQVMPLGMIEIKTSTLFKYIGSSPLSSKSFIVIIILYYIFINVVSIFILMFTAMIFFKSEVFTGHRVGLFSGVVTPMGGFSFFFANLLHIILGLSIGIAISTFAKTPQQALTLGLLIVFPSMFLSGMVVTVDIIAQSKSMQIISYFMPFKYTTANIIVSATPSPQIGDFLDLLRLDENNNRTAENLKVIFEPGDKINSSPIIDGHPTFGLDDKQRLWYRGIEIKTTDQLLAIYDDKLAHGDIDSLYNPIQGGIVRKDARELFEIIFIDGRSKVAVSSGNNVFALDEEFGVRRVPDIQSIKSLIKTWLDKTYAANGPDSMTGVLDAIKAGKYEWMDLFLKQSSVVYYVYDRVLNIFLPIILIGGLRWYSVKNFKWTAR